MNTTDNPHRYIKVMLAHNFVDRTNLRLDFVVVVVPSNEVKSDRKIFSKEWVEQRWIVSRFQISASNGLPKTSPCRAWLFAGGSSTKMDGASKSATLKRSGYLRIKRNAP